VTDRPDSLDQVPLLAHLPPEVQELVAAAGHRRRLSRGEVLFHEGDPAQAMFAVCGGRMKLVRYSPRGKELLLHLVHSGQSFAEAALFGEQTYPATAVAVETSELWCWPAAKLVELLRHHPTVGLAIVGSMSRWTRRLAAKLELLTQRRVEERVAVYLLSRSAGRPLVAGDTLDLAEPRNLIAAQCGTAPEVLSRTFRRLEDDGVVEAAADHVRVLDPDRLRALAEWIGD